MNFLEADQRYQWYFDLYQSGKITIEQLQAEVAKIQVVDSAGRTWMKQAGSGQWFVFVNNQWIAANPQPPENAVQQPTPPVQTDLPPKKRSAWLIPVLIGIVVLCCIAGVAGGGLWLVRTGKAPWLQNLTANIPLVGEKSSGNIASFSSISSTSLAAGTEVVVGSENMQVAVPENALDNAGGVQVVSSQINGNLADSFQQIFNQDVEFYELIADGENDGTGHASLQVPATKDYAVLLEVLDETYLAVSELPLENGAFQVDVPIGSKPLDQRDESVSLQGSHHFAIVQLDSSALSSTGAHLAMVTAAGDPRSCGIELVIGEGYMIPYPKDTVVSYCRKNLAGTIQVMVYPQFTPSITKEKVDPVVDMIEKIMAFYQSKGFTAVNLKDSWLSRVQVVIEMGSGDPYYSSVNGLVHIPQDSLGSSYGKNLEYELAHELAHWVQDEAYNFTSSYWANLTGVSSEAKWWFEVSAENMVMLYKTDYIDHNLTTYGMTTPASHDTPFQYSPNQWNDQLYAHAQLVKLFMCSNEYACPISFEQFVNAINTGEYPYNQNALDKINNNLEDYALYLLGKQVVSANSTIPNGGVRDKGTGYGEFITVKAKNAAEIEYAKTGYAPQMEPVILEGIPVIKINVPIQKLGAYPLTVNSPGDSRMAGFPVEVVVESGAPFWYTLDDGKEKYHDGKSKITLGPIHTTLGYQKLRLVAFAKDEQRTFVAKVQPLNLKGDWLVFSDGVTSQNFSCNDVENVETTIDYANSAQFSALYTSLLHSVAGLYLPDSGGLGYTWAALPGADLKFGGKVPLGLSGVLLLNTEGILLQSKLDMPQENAGLPSTQPLLSGLPFLGFLAACVVRRKRRELFVISMIACLLLLTGCVGFGGLYGTIATDTHLKSFEDPGGRTIQSIAQSTNAGVVSDEEDGASIPTGFAAVPPTYVFKGTSVATLDIHMIIKSNQTENESICSGTINYNVIAVFIEDGVINSLGN